MIRPLRVANCSGFYGDRLSAAREMVEGGPIDVLTGDYLAELTMMLLHRDRQADPSTGYAKTFPVQLAQVAAACLERGIKIVVDAGGLAPAACAAACAAVYRRLGLEARIAHLEGDDLLPRLDELRRAGERFEHLEDGRDLASLEEQPGRDVLTANAYLGAWGIAQALSNGADLVICPRVTDASLVVGPAAWHFGWARDDWHRLASAVVAGHVLECGAQATGGNYSFFERVPGFAADQPFRAPGFPIAEISEDGSFVVTKHAGTGGRVSVGTVTAQLLYEIDGPRYRNPDVVARFDTISLEPAGPDRVRVHGVRGEPPPPTTKVCINYRGGYRNSVSFLLGGLDLDAKAALVERALWHSLGGRDTFDETQTTLLRAAPGRSADDGHTTFPGRGVDENLSVLRIAVRDRDRNKVDRRFSGAAVELALASYPGCNLAAPPAKARPFGVYWPTLVRSEHLRQRVTLARVDVEDGEGAAQVFEVEPASAAREAASEAAASSPAQIEAQIEAQIDARAPHAAADPLETGPIDTVLAPLGRVCGARSGDKGGNANLGVWVESEAAFDWLCRTLTVDRLRALVPGTESLEVERHGFPRLRAVHFLLRGFLGDGVGANLALDAQAKGLGEFLRAQVVPIPRALLENDGS